MSLFLTPTQEPVRKKRRSHKVQRTENDGSAAPVDLVAMGTQAGTILLYSIAKADIHRQMVKNTQHPFGF